MYNLFANGFFRWWGDTSKKPFGHQVLVDGFIIDPPGKMWSEFFAVLLLP